MWMYNPGVSGSSLCLQRTHANDTRRSVRMCLCCPLGDRDAPSPSLRVAMSQFEGQSEWTLEFCAALPAPSFAAVASLCLATTVAVQACTRSLLIAMYLCVYVFFYALLRKTSRRPKIIRKKNDFGLFGSERFLSMAIDVCRMRSTSHHSLVASGSYSTKQEVFG
jgi:hypothetical protein